MTPGEYYRLIDWTIKQADCWAGALTEEAARIHRAKLKALRREVTARRRAESGIVTLKVGGIVGRSLNLR